MQGHTTEAEQMGDTTEGIDEDVAMDLDDIVTKHKRGWADAVVKWMDNISLHVKALKSLTDCDPQDNNQHRTSGYIARVNLKFVDVAPEFRDTQMQPYGAFMKEFEENDRDRQATTEWLCERKSLAIKAWNKSMFMGHGIVRQSS